MCEFRQGHLLEEVAFVLDISESQVDQTLSFIANGGDSISAILLQRAFRRRGLQLPLQLILNRQPLHQMLEKFGTADRKMSSCDLSIANCNTTNPLREETKFLRACPDSICTKSDHERTLSTYHSKVAPMTDMQLALYLSTNADPSQNIISYCETHHSMDIPRLKLAWAAVIKSEPIFRCRFEVYENEGFIIEEEEEEEDVALDWEETFTDDEVGLEAEVTQCVRSATGFGSRFKVFTPGKPGQEVRSILIWQIHHALIDGYSCDVIRSKIRSFLSGHQLRPGPSFVDFSKDLAALQEGHETAACEFWKRCHNRVSSPATRLILSPQRAGAVQAGVIVRDYSKIEISNYCYTREITPAAVYHGAWALAIAPYMGSKQISFGTAFSGRTLPLENILDFVGPTINTLPFYVSLNSNITAKEYLDRIFSSLVELSVFQWSVPKHGFSRDFSTAINVILDDLHRNDSSNSICPLEPPKFHITSDIPLYVEVSGSGAFRLHYHSSKYPRPIVQRIADKFKLALEVLQDENMPLVDCISRLSALDTPDLARMGNWLSPQSRVGKIDDDLVTIFTRTALQNPCDAAVQRGDYSLTYHDLHLQSGYVARYLSEVIHPDDVVCVHADRSVNWIIAIYAILKAGAIYCPIDSSSPMALRDIIFKNAKATWFIASSKQDGAFCPASCRNWTSVEEILSDPSADLEANIIQTPKPRPDAGAYLCFTSGTSGKPKGVLCKHAALIAFQSTFEVRLRSAPGERIAQVMSPGFDGSIHEIFSALGYGAALILPDAAKPFEHLKDVTTALLTPSLAKVLEPSCLDNLKHMYLVGESVSQETCDTWAALPDRKLYNMYGPTEGTCGATIKRLQPAQPVTIGLPNASTRIYLLDDELHLVPFGAIGEICLAGVQVAAGYIGQPGESATKFPPDTVQPSFAESMYRTGDCGYWNGEGELVFCGRRDRQVKLRGFRIDLDDLEVRMQRASRCRDIAITLQEDYLVAQIQPGDIDVASFKASIEAHIPAYAIPRRLEAVGKFPLTNIGKIDYRAIASSDSSKRAQVRRPYSNGIERLVIDAAIDILGCSPHGKINLQSSLVDLGATSVLQLGLANRLSRVLQCKVPIRLIFECATLHDLVLALESADRSSEISSQELGEHGISPIEKHWWQKYQHKGGSPAFNVTFACSMGPEVDVTKLISVWNTVLARHRILRCRYKLSEHGEVYRIYAELPPVVIRKETFVVQEEVDKCFNLECDDLICVVVSANIMLINASHIICDLTTLRILLQDVASLYNGDRLQDVSRLYSQTRWPTIASPLRLDFWNNTLAKPSLAKRGMGHLKKRKSWSGTSHHCDIPVDSFTAMKSFAVKHQVTMHQISLAAVALLLQRGEETCDITLGAPFLNRNCEEDQDIVGLFLEPIPIRIRFPNPDSDKTSFINAVRASSHAAISNAVPWDILLAHLNAATELPDQAFFGTMVSFHDRSSTPGLSIRGLKSMNTCATGAKFNLMIEFNVLDDQRLAMRLEYSDEIFLEQEIKILSQRLVKELETLVDDI